MHWVYQLLIRENERKFEAGSNFRLNIYKQSYEVEKKYQFASYGGILLAIESNLDSILMHMKIMTHFHRQKKYLVITAEKKKNKTPPLKKKKQLTVMALFEKKKIQHITNTTLCVHKVPQNIQCLQLYT